jgi:hypothetical protein
VGHHHDEDHRNLSDREMVRDNPLVEAGASCVYDDLIEAEMIVDA